MLLPAAPSTGRARLPAGHEDDLEVRPPLPTRPPIDGSGVTAVLVAHDGAAWLPAVLAALEASTTRPGQLVLADTGSTDGSAALLASAGPVLRLPPDTGYGAAVAAALAAVPTTPWVWLLHDDAAPDPHALAALLDHAQVRPEIAMVGPKSRDWDDERLLVEVGLTTDLSGHRATGVDVREYDQGQRDDPRDVLAVGTAGALVRRSAWDAVGGLDPALPVYRDDLDLGWRLNAAGHRVVVLPVASQRHVRAATTGRRALGAVRGRPGGVDRRHALHVLLAHASRRSLPLLAVALVLSCALRAAGFLLTRQVLAARDEVGALVAVLARPDRLRDARRDRRRTRRRSPRELRPLLAGRTERLRNRVEDASGWLTDRLTRALGGTPGQAPDPYGPLGDAGPDGPDAMAELAPAGPGVVRLLVRQPAVLVVLGLVALTALAERSLLHGGALLGGRLLPLPARSSDLWTSYAASWHDVQAGSAAAAAPVVGVLAALSTVLLGRPGLAIDLVLLGAVPLAGATAYAAAGRVTRSGLLRAWAACTWALLPVATAGVATGSLDVAAVQVALPLLLVGGVALLRDDVRDTGWRRAWALGLALGITAGFAPLLWPVAAALLVGAALVRPAPRRLLAALVAAITPLVVLGPWLPGASWDALLDGPGRILPDAAPAAWQLVLLTPGGPGTPAAWLLLGVVLAGLAGLTRGARAAWLLAALGLGLALALTRTGHAPGLGLQLAGAGVVLAVLSGADGLRERLAGASFGWRQISAAGLAVLAALTPLGAGLAWMSEGADQPLTRERRPVLPAFAAAELTATPGLRVLSLRPTGARVSYALSTGGGPGFGDADTPMRPEQSRALDAVVADLVTARGSDAAEALATRAVRYVVLPASQGAAPVAAALDSQSGLTRRTSGSVLMWRVLAPSAPLSVLSGGTADAARSGARAAGPALQRTAPPQPLSGSTVRVGPGRPGRLVVLAQAADPGWRATYDGRELAPVTAWGWAQAFALPAGKGVVKIEHTGHRGTAVALQGLWLLVVVVLAGPGARRRQGLEVLDDVEDTQAVLP